VGAANAGETAAYIALMAADLARIAGAAHLMTLSYLLNMARLEAEDHLTGLSPPPH
jgi:hypothetical protein